MLRPSASLAVLFFALLFAGSIGAQPYTSYWPNGRKKEQGTFTDSIPTGVWMNWYENGALKDSGAYVKLTPAMVVIDPAAPIPDKDTNAFKLQAISISKTPYTETGYWKRFNENGSLSEEGAYLPLANLFAPLMMDSTGQSAFYSIGYPAPIKTGTWKYYDENGILQYSQVYKTVQGGDLKTEYYPGGKKKSEGMFFENYYRYEGVKKEWNSEGKLIRETTFNRSGKVIAEKTY